jgi:NAD(P)-dependent dehydrogenase (short-subunit alcohol dehydrogenase family)
MDGVKRLFDVNYFSIFQLIQQALPSLRNSNGRIILISSGAATKVYKGWAPYCASKAALNMLAASVAKEEPLVTTISIRPGILDTDMQTLLREKGKDCLESDMYQYFVDAHKNQQLIAPMVSGAVIAKLCHDIPKDLSGRFLDWTAEELNF